MKIFTRMKRVEVIWLDAALENSNMPQEEAKALHPLERHNVGYLVDDDGVTLRLSFGTISDMDKKCSICSDILMIPKSCVESIKKLR